MRENLQIRRHFARRVDGGGSVVEKGDDDEKRRRESVVRVEGS